MNAALTDKERIFTDEYIASLPHKTPYFLFSKERLKHNVDEFAHDFPDANVFYAMKANFDKDILRHLNECGVGFEVASKFELEILQKLSVDPKKIIYGTAIKPADHIQAFHQYGVEVYACDTMEELHKIAKHAPGAKVFVRLHADNHSSGVDLSEKFGTSPKQAVELLLACSNVGLDAHGVSFHVGSQAVDVQVWSQHLEQVKEVISEVEEKGVDLTIINIGGGYPCKYSSFQNHIALMDIATTVESELKRLNLTQQIVTEPGRRIVANTGIAVTSVIGRSEKHGKNWLFLDMGVYSGLMQTAKFQESTRYYMTSLDEKQQEGQELTVYSLAGPTGDGPDVIDREVLLPKDIKTGDRIVIHDIGAYSLPTICPFHAFPSPCVYIV